MKKTLILALWLVMISGYNAFADDDVQVYNYPEIKPKVSITGGYRFVDLKGSEMAGEYDYHHDSVTFNGEIVAFPFPHRFHLELDVLNKKNYFWDMSYAYKDIVLSRWINRTNFHNLKNIGLVDPGASAGYTVDVRDASERYGIRSGLDVVFLRLKTPDFPFHVFIDGRFTNKDGDRQQRFFGGSAYFDNLKRTSQKSSTDWKTRDVAFGVNSHLGPLEAEFSHSMKAFEAGGDRVFVDYYTAAAVRAAGNYPHNLVPDLKGSLTTIKLHTSYTGKLVASTSLSWAGRENSSSGAKADYFAGEGEIVWMPLTRLTVFFKYGHKDTDAENPSVLPANYMGFGSYTSPIAGVRNSISSKTDAVSGIIRYRVSKGLTLKAKYSYDRQEREHAEEWFMDEVTRRSTVSLSADARPAKGLKLGAKYEHQEIDRPAYNSQPNRADSGLVSASWAPVKAATAFLSYNVKKEERGDIRYAGMQPATQAKDRDATMDRFMGSLVFFLPGNVSLTTSYSYLHSEVEQDLIYNDFSGADQLDSAAKYKDSAQNYTVNLNYAPTKRLDLAGGVSHTRGRATFSPNVSDALQPIDIGSLSALSMRETGYTLSGGYAFMHDWKAGLNYKYNKYEDLIDNPYNPEDSEGVAQVVFLTVSRQWQ
ncbi:MAG: MtrB/PioB family outer membrane beta-barrel protein [Thermodesulfovibrionales bacterium]|nr:MtrB/PioB family outer membrane beta-barrel protein [Thermodesulfovibrionales bacterium]